MKIMGVLLDFVAAHAILDGTAHTDSVADAVTKGSLIVGNATPKWDELVVGTDEYSLVAASGQTLGLKWAKRASITTATQTIYVDGDATGAADGTSWTDAFTTIQAAWDCLPDIIAHAVTIRCRSAAAAYAEDIDIDSRFVVASVTIEGEHYAYGACEANVGGAGEITDTGAFGDVAVGDRVYVIDRTGALDQAVQYEVCTVDDIANAPNRIGTDGALTPTTGWYYAVVRTHITGSDARNYCFSFTSIANILLKGLLITNSDWSVIESTNARNIDIYGCIFEAVDRGIWIASFSDFFLDTCYLEGDDYILYSNAASTMQCESCSVDGGGNTTATEATRISYLFFNGGVIGNSGRGMWALGLSYGFPRKSIILNTVTTGLYALYNSVIYPSQVNNLAAVPKDPAAAADAAYIA